MGCIRQHSSDHRSQHEPGLWTAVQQSPCDSWWHAQPNGRQAALFVAGKLGLQAATNYVAYVHRLFSTLTIDGIMIHVAAYHPLCSVLPALQQQQRHALSDIVAEVMQYNLHLLCHIRHVHEWAVLFLAVARLILYTHASVLS